MKGRLWRVIKNMYEASRSAILLEGEKSAAFRVEQGVAQGSSLSPILFSVFNIYKWVIKGCRRGCMGLG